MTYGIRLTGTERDLAALHSLAEESAALVMAPWTALSPAPPSPASVITCEALDAPLAQRLRAKGVDVVRVTRSARGASFAGAKGAPNERYEPCDAREARTLVEALRPVRVAGDPPCAEALFLADLDGDGAQRTLERLLALGRDDFTVSEVTFADDGRRALLARVPSPPMYLLLRAREEPAEGVTAFARAGDGDVWVEWPWAQPLGHVVSRLARAAGQTALVSRDGHDSVGVVVQRGLTKHQLRAESRPSERTGRWRPGALDYLSTSSVAARDAHQFLCELFVSVVLAVHVPPREFFVQMECKAVGCRSLGYGETVEFGCFAFDCRDRPMHSRFILFVVDVFVTASTPFVDQRHWSMRASFVPFDSLSEILSTRYLHPHIESASCPQPPNAP